VVLSQVLIDCLHLFLLTAALGMLLMEVGLISLGHAGMLLVGAYACGFAVQGSLSLGSALLMVFSASALFAIPVIRVRTDVFAVITLAFSQIAHRVCIAAVPWTGGALGLGPLQRPSWVSGDWGAIVLGTVGALFAAVCYWIAMDSTFGLVLGAGRDDNLATQACGFATNWRRYVVVASTGICAAMVGVLQTGYFGLATPQMGTLEISLQALAAAILVRPVWRQGKPIRALAGYAISSATVVFVPALLRQILPGGIEEAILRRLLFGFVLYLLVHPVITKRIQHGGWR
jgi:branched-chain amino acid transport system permease protein